MTRRFWTILVLMVVGLALSATILTQRVTQERHLGPVGVMMYFSDVVTLAQQSGTTWQQALARFHQAGVTTVGMDPRDLNLLQQLQQATVYPAAQLSANPSLYSQMGGSGAVHAGDTYVWTTSSSVAQAVKQGFGTLATTTAVKQGYLVDVGVAPATAMTWPLGFDASLDQQLAAQGFSVVYRLTDHPEAGTIGNATELKTLPQDARVIFGGPSVIGFPNHLTQTERILAQKNSSVAVIEFQTQPGLQTVIRALHYRGFRTLGLRGAYVAQLTDPVAASKLALGAQERKDRLLVIHAPGPTVQSAIDLVKLVHQDVTRAGLQTGAPVPQPYQATGRIPLLLASFAIVAGAFWLFMEAGWFTSSEPEAWLPWAMLTLDAVLWFGLGVDRTRRLAALGAGVVFPTLAILRFLAYPVTSRLFPLAGRILEALGITVVGALVAAAMLSSSPFYLDIEQFLGVKALFVVPLLLFTWFYWRRYAPEGTTIGTIWRTPIEVRHVVIGAVVAFGMVLFITRTGNSPIIGASNLQQAGRSALQHVLGVRPRTKEFLLGWPALLVGTYFLSLRWRWFGFFALALGTIGLEDIVDTFAHLHIPLMLSVERTILGAVIGWVIGIIGYLVIRWVVRRWVSPPEARPSPEPGD